MENRTNTNTSPEALQIGDVVEISGAYYKNYNGFYFVNYVPGSACWSGRDVSLHKIGKTGKLIKNNSTLSWPLQYYSYNDAENEKARTNDRANAKLSRAENVPLEGVAEYFRKELAEYEERITRNERRGDYISDAERARLEELRGAVSRFAGISAPVKEAETGIKFYWNGIKVNGGELIKCWYYLRDNGTVSICARDYGKQLPREYFTVKNETDLYSDYFDTDGAEVSPDHPLYKYVKYNAWKSKARGEEKYLDCLRGRIEKSKKSAFWQSYVEDKQYELKRREEWLQEWQQMKDPGQPTAEDLEAVETMKTAAENARIEAEKAARIEEREKYLRQRSAGREYIETVQAAHPVEDGAPVVEITFSEHPAFHSWTQSRDQIKWTITKDAKGRTVDEKKEITVPRRRCLLSVSAADIILKHFDEEAQKRDDGYYKTYFTITWKNAETGDEDGYEGRYDIGDGDGGLVAHVRMIAEWDRDNAPNDDCRRAALKRIKTADFLAGFLPGGRVVKVELAPWAAAVLEQKRQKEAEARERFDDTLAAVEMLTDEQLIHAVNLAPYADPEKRDVGRFFLQQLAKRDEKKALDVFRRWVKGEEAPIE